jgi:hypothetical protein
VRVEGTKKQEGLMGSKGIFASAWAQFGAWIFGVTIVGLSLEYLADTELTAWWTMLLLALALFLIFGSPLFKLGAPRTFEIGLSTVFILIFMLHLGMAVIYPKIEADDEDSRPCGRKTKEFQCYNLTREVCLSAYSHYHSDCTEEARAAAKGPTQLVGSTVRHCISERFKKYMSYNLKTDAPADCKH